MKLTYRDIDGFLKARPAVPVVLVYGPDRGLMKERVKILARTVVADVNDPFNVTVLTHDQIMQDPARLSDEASAMSLMGGDRVVMIQGAGDGLAAVLKDYLKDPARHSLIILEADDLSTRSSLRKLIEDHKDAAALPCYALDARDLVGVIKTRVQEALMTIDHDAALWMAEAVAGDMAQAYSEIEKLLTYMGVGPDGRAPTLGGRVTLEDVQACLGGLGAAALDGWVDAWFLGDAARAMEGYQRLLDDGVAMIVLIRTALAHARKILVTHERLKAGEDFEQMMKGRDAPVFFKRRAAFQAQLKKWPTLRLLGLMQDIAAAEAKLKSGVDPDIIWPQAILALAKKAG